MVANEAVAFTFNSTSSIKAHQFAHSPILGFLSVIIPVYQDAKGLRDTLEALVTQSLPASRFEVIVANDGGEEAIHLLCLEFKTTEVVLRPNQGAYAARNAGLAESRGEFIAFTDADVVLDPDWCLHGTAALAKADVVAGATELMLSGPLNTCQIFQLANYFPSENLIKGRMAQTVNTFIRREVFASRPWFDERLRSGGDIEFTQRAGLDPALRYTYDPTVKARHPTRTHEQLIGSLKRIIFGQLNVYHLIPERREILAPHICKTYRLLFPPLRLYSSDISHLHLKLTDYLALYFFCWWSVKLQMYRLVHEAKREWQRCETAKN